MELCMCPHCDGYLTIDDVRSGKCPNCGKDPRVKPEEK